MRDCWCFLTMPSTLSMSSSVSLAPMLGISASTCACVWERGTKPPQDRQGRRAGGGVKGTGGEMKMGGEMKSSSQKKKYALVFTKRGKKNSGKRHERLPYTAVATAERKPGDTDTYNRPHPRHIRVIQRLCIGSLL